MKDNSKNTKQKIVNNLQDNIDKEYILQLKCYQDWDSVLKDSVLGPLVSTNYALVKKDFTDLKRESDGIHEDINENLNKALYDFDREQLDIEEEEAYLQSISDSISQSISDSISQGISDDDAE